MPVVNHENLIWARQQAKLTLEEAAHKLQLKDSGKSSAVEKLEAFESGESIPSRSKLSQMAKVYRKPLLSFYLPEAPITPSRGEDFRTLPNQLDHLDDFHIDTLIRDIRVSQNLLRKTLEEEDEAEVLPFIGSHTVDDGISTVANTIKNSIGFSLIEYRKQGGLEDAFRYLRRQVEKAGVFVILRGNLGSFHTDIAVKAFRGFALSDDIAPFIVINDKDAKSAWCFTLLHEFAHLVLGKTGLSGGIAEQAIEKFCNDVASEIILPSPEFGLWQVLTEDFDELKIFISNYADSMNVSASHIAYRLHKRGDITQSMWANLSSFYREQWIKGQKQKKASRRKDDKGPSYYTLRRYSLGSSLVDVAQRLTQSGALSTTKAGTLLGVKPLNVHKLFTNNMFMEGS